MKTRLGCRAQSTAEYAVLFGLVVAAVVGMSVYVRRAVQAKIKVGTDAVKIPGAQDLGQYEPYYAQSQRTTTQTQDITEGYAQGATTRQGSTGATSTGTEATMGAGALGQDDAWQ